MLLYNLGVLERWKELAMECKRMAVVDGVILCMTPAFGTGYALRHHLSTIHVSTTCRDVKLRSYISEQGDDPLHPVSNRPVESFTLTH